MKNYVYKLFVLLFALLPISCDRSGIWEEYQKDVPWNFCVAVYSDQNRTEPISGATVEIYKTKDDRDNGRNVFLSKQTEVNGEALFTFAEFNSSKQGAEALKGNYYLRIRKGSITKNETTRYLLMNSGTTYHWIVLQ